MDGTARDGCGQDIVCRRRHPNPRPRRRGRHLRGRFVFVSWSPRARARALPLFFKGRSPRSSSSPQSSFEFYQCAQLHRSPLVGLQCRVMLWRVALFSCPPSCVSSRTSPPMETGLGAIARSAATLPRPRSLPAAPHGRQPEGRAAARINAVPILPKNRFRST